jgi:ribosomal protein S18 acetylase RimI-like enzyme
MINTKLQVRRATPQDHHQIAGLLFHEANLHRHLDWRPPLDWLGEPNYWVLEEAGRIVAALACPQDPPLVSWIRLFGYLPHISGLDAWQVLWNTARGDMAAGTGSQVAAIVVKSWFQRFLLSSGFAIRQYIILLELNNERFRSFPAPQDTGIRHMQTEDLREVSQLDREVFGGFWHNSFDSLQRAHSQAAYASVAESISGLVGYQISTGNAFGSHLARLGVRMDARGRGVGAALVSDLIQRLDPHHLARLSVNTQADNTASLRLYEKVGFVRTGEQFPVLVHREGD